MIACDAVAGLLIACALIMPSKKLAEVSVRTVNKKFRAKDFARGVDRNRILVCEGIGIPRETFFQISLHALTPISTEIGL